MGNNTSILETARKYVSQGYSVVPIKKGEKRPAINWDEYQSRLPSDSELCSWFENSDNQIGIVTGNVSGGLFILDFDGENYEQSFLEFLDKFPEFQNSIIIKTGSGRYHIYGKCAFPITTTREVKEYPDGKGKVELRANSHQTLVPPSVHPNGNHYEVFEGTTPITISLNRFNEIRVWITPEVKDAPDNKKPDGWQEDIFQGVCEGERNTSLVKETGRLLGKGLSRSEILPVLLKANSNFNPPLDNNEVESVLDSMIKTDERNNPKRDIKTDNYKFINRKELITMEETEVKWFWDGILPTGGLSLLLAKPKVGKTVFCLNLAFHGSRGSPFLGKSTTQGNVIYLALEESKDEVKKSLIAFEKTHGEPDEEHLFFHFGIAPTDAIQKLEKAMEEIKPTFVVIDILQKFLKLKKIEDYAEVITRLEPLMDIARRLGCHILLTHHAPKSERELIDSALGSTGLAASVDTIILEKKDVKERRSFSTAQRYRKLGEADIKDWVINLAKDEITLELAGTTFEVNSSDAKEQILKLLENIGGENFYTEPMTEPQIREEIKKSKAQTLGYLKELYQEKKIKREGTGRKNDPFKYSIEPVEAWRRVKKGQATFQPEWEC